MKADDDPEARIRELERPLSELAKAAELTTSSVAIERHGAPPRDSVQRFAIVFGAVAAVFMFAATAAAVYLIAGVPSGVAPEPSRSSTAPTPRPITAVPDGVINITGAGESKTVACVGNYVVVGGAGNTVLLTGQCAGLAVSGARNVITVDSTSKITVSGVRNQVTYHSGDPEVVTSGFENVVARG